MTEAIKRKLRTEFCPYLVTARHLQKWPPYRVYTLYSYFGEVIVLLAGFGLANPVLDYLNSPSVASTAQAAAGPSALAEFLSSGTSSWIAAVLLVLWGLVKFYIRREDLEKRCSLMTSYRRQCLGIERALRGALGSPDPMPKLIELQQKLGDLVDRNIAESSIPDLGIAPNLDHKIDAECNALVSLYAGNWTDVPTGERSQQAGEPK